jgi:tetratricopeptide (TPR) repeat protein
MRPSSVVAAAQPSSARPWILSCVLVALTVAAYHNSLRAPFIFDDDSIVESFQHHHRSPAQVMIQSTRPVVQLSFAANYAVGGLDVRGYHVVNLVVHVLAALLLFGIARRSLQCEAGGRRDGSGAAGLAFAIALIWAVHPLQTESVTYVIQRAESLAGLLSLATVYFVLRGASSGRSRIWYGAAAIACVLGMGSKPVMVATPVLVLLYDRVFLAGSWRGAWRRRGVLYLCLAASWTILIALLGGHHESETTAGFSMPGLSAAHYARSQPGVVLHYLGLVVWPRGLVLDYAWPVAESWIAILVPGLALGTLLAVTVWAFRRRPPLGFLGAAFLLLLAPSSSFIPIKDLAAEHRMYLPLAPVVALLVLGTERLVRALTRTYVTRRYLSFGLLLTGAGVLVLLTVGRNAEYRSPMDMWRNVVARRPSNPRAHNNLAYVLFQTGRIAESRSHAARAVELDPDYGDAHVNLGRALAEQGEYDAASQQYLAALRLRPDHAAARNDLGIVLQKLNHPELAIRQYDEALRLDPDYAEAYNNRGLALAGLQRYVEAIGDYARALRLRPDYVEVYGNLGNARLAQGDVGEAIREYGNALRLAPNHAEMHYNLAIALAAQGKHEEARAHYAEAVRLKPALSGAVAGSGMR